MIKYLSHIIMPRIPVYGLGCKRKIDLKPIKSIKKGDSSLTFRFGMENHWGTHVDCPAHIFNNGSKVADYKADFWIFRKPQVLSVKLKAGQILKASDLNAEIKRETDLLILRSGWNKVRGKRIYTLANPGIDPDFAKWLKKQFPLIRAIGFDWISVSSYKDRQLGRKAHREFLRSGLKVRPILLIEDMDLSKELKGLKQVWVAPFLISGLDSAPCTVMGIFK